MQSAPCIFRRGFGVTNCSSGGAAASGEALRLAAFNVVSIVTTTGFAIAEYGLWGRFAAVAFFTFFIGSFAGLALALGLLGLDYVTAVSDAATALANVGPGLGEIIGPAGNFATLPDGAKWVLSVGMLIGRLEVFTVFVLLTPAFWRS